MIRSRAPLRVDEAGITLVEVVIATVIFGLAVAAILGALFSLVKSSAAHREQSQANAVLASAAEAVLDPDRNSYKGDCPAPSPAYLPTVGVTMPPSWTAAAAISKWDGGAACVPNTAMQTITITVTAPAGNSYSLEVLRRP